MAKHVSLSKSRFCTGMQCLKQLYWLINPPADIEQIEQADNPQLEAIFQQGHEVGVLAQQRFPGGVLVDEDHTEHRQAVARTRNLIRDPAVPAIYEATFTFENVRIRVDVLERVSRDQWRLIEVKSTTVVKDCHLADVAIQKYVAKGCGLRITQACLMHLDRSYCHTGEEYNLQKLFTIEDVSDRIRELYAEIPALLKQQKRALQGKTPPVVEPGEQCTSPYECEFYELCNEPLPDDWPGNLPGLRAGKIAELQAMGVKSMHDIPEDFSLSLRQQTALACVRTGRPHIDSRIIAEINDLPYPRYFMDFETIFPALPRFAGMRPFDQIPFQWSVHVRMKKNSRLRHFEFLARDAHDPRAEFTEKLLQALGNTGPIIVYNAPFEKTRLQELAAWLPQHARAIKQVQNRIWDLLPAIKDYVYHPAFMGSYSLKTVLPAFVPDMSYEQMKVADGTQAGLAYEELNRNRLSPAEQKALRKALLAYCGQDTLGLVRLMEAILKAG